MTPITYRPTFPAGTRVIDAQAQLWAAGYELKLRGRFGVIARRVKNNPPPRAA